MTGPGIGPPRDPGGAVENRPDVFFQWTDYGFRWGAMEVQRLFSHHDGSVWLRVRGATGRVDIYVSPQGRSVRCWATDNVKLGEASS